MKSKLNRLAVYHIKGGVGKTRIALNLALTMEFGVVTNDPYSAIEKALPGEKRIILHPGESLPKIPETIPLIYDLGGHADHRSIWALRDSQFVIFPVLPNKEDLDIGLNFIEEVGRYNQNIIVAINRTKPGEFENPRKVFGKYYPNLPVFEIKESRAMSLIIENRMSISELAIQNKLHKHHYEKIERQFTDIIVYMKKRLNRRKTA